jgi:hypothetical protein
VISVCWNEHSKRFPGCGDGQPLSQIGTSLHLTAIDFTYVEYLMSTFEIAWEQLVLAAQRKEELPKRASIDLTGRIMLCNSVDNTAVAAV